jgi:hypothetical protein
MLLDLGYEHLAEPILRRPLRVSATSNVTIGNCRRYRLSRMIVFHVYGYS